MHFFNLDNTILTLTSASSRSGLSFIFWVINLIAEKWNKPILSVWIFYSPGFFSPAFIVTICHDIRAFLSQRCFGVETPVLNVTIGREAEIVGQVMQGQITQLSSVCSNPAIKMLKH